MYEKINAFFSTISNVVNLVTFSTMLFSLAVILFLLITDKRRIITEIAESVLEDTKYYKKKFKNYTSQVIEDVTLMEHTFVIKNIKKSIRKGDVTEKFWFIIGEAGFGKTLLIEKLILSYCLRRRFRVKSLFERGVVYIRLSSVQDINDLKGLIEKNIGKGQNVIFLDGFDEFRELRNRDAIEVLSDVIFLLKKNINSYRKIIITSRIEPISGGILTLRDYKINSSSKNRRFDKLRILKILPFNKKQILALYKKVGGSGENLNKPQKGRYEKLMREHLNTCKSSVFEIPFLINYADIILSFYNSDKTKQFTRSEIYNKLIQFWIDREYEIYCMGVDKESDVIPIIEYERNAHHTMRKVVEYMVDNDTNQISYTQLKSVCIFEEGIDFNNLITRRLMHQFRDGYFEFAHLSFYEFLIAKMLLDSSFATRKKYLSNSAYETIKSIYIDQLLISSAVDVNEIIDSVDYISIGSKSYNDLTCCHKDLELIMSSDVIKCKEERAVSIDEILTIFPTAKRIMFKNFALEGDDLDDYMVTGYLDLSNRGTQSLNGINCFHNLKALDISNNTIEYSEALLSCKCLDELFIYETSHVDISILLPLKLKRLGISIFSSSYLNKLIEELKPLKFTVDVKGEILLYVDLNRLKKSGVDIELKAAIEQNLLEKFVNQTNNTNDLISVLDCIYNLHKDRFPNHIATLLTGYELGRNLTEQEKYEAGEIPLRDVYEKSKEVFGEKVADTLTVGYVLGLNLTEQKKYEEGETLLSDVYEKEKEVFGEKAANTLTTGHVLGLNLTEQKKYEEGEALLRDVYEKCKKVLGEKAADTLTTGHVLGHNLTEQKKYDEGEILLSDVYEKKKEVLGEKAVDTLTTGHELGRNLTEQNKYEEGETLLSDVYEKRKEVLGEKAADTLTTGHQLGLILIEQKKYEEGETLLRDIYDKRKEVSGEMSASTLITGHLLGLNLTEQKKYEEGETLLRDVYEKRKEVSGKKAAITILIGDALGLNLTKQKKYEEGEALLRDVYEKKIEVFGEEEACTLATGYLLGLNLTEQKKYEEGETLLRDVYEKSKEVFGEKEADTLTTGHELGRNLTEQKKYEEGETLLRDVYEKRKEVLGETAAVTLKTGHELGRNLTEQKTYEEGETLLRDVYEKEKAVLGEEAANTQATGQEFGLNLTNKRSLKRARLC